MSKSRHPVIKGFIIFFLIIIILAVAAYFFLPRLFVKAMMSDSLRDQMPSNVTGLMNRSEKEIDRVLATVKLTPGQAKEEIDNINFNDLERVYRGARGKQSMTKNEMVQLITKEINFKYLDAAKIKRYLPDKISKKDIDHYSKIFDERKTEIRLLFPAIKSGLKQMIDERSQ